MVKNLPANAGDIRDLGQEDPLEEEMVAHSSTLAWKIAWTEEPGVLQSMGSQRVEHDLATEQQQQNILFALMMECLLWLPNVMIFVH